MHKVKIAWIVLVVIVASFVSAVTTFDWSAPGQTGTLTYTGLALVNPVITGENTVDGKYAVVGPDATTGLMILGATITAPNQALVTNTFATAFLAAPTVTLTYTEDPGDVRPAFVSSVTSNAFVAGITADKNFAYTAVGARP